MSERTLRDFDWQERTFYMQTDDPDLLVRVTPNVVQLREIAGDLYVAAYCEYHTGDHDACEDCWGCNARAKYREAGLR